MAERRPLVQGLKTKPSIDRAVEQAFVFNETMPPGEATIPDSPVQTEHAEDSTSTPTEIRSPNNRVRVPLTTRLRADFALALKRASLERQLQASEPNTVQDILEVALEPWLQQHGYLT